MTEQDADGLRHDAIDEVARRHAKHEDRQARGAWRAGYDYVFKIASYGDPTAGTAYIPSNDAELMKSNRDTIVERWPIYHIDDAEAQEVLGRD